MTDHDRPLRRLRDALVLTQAAIEEDLIHDGTQAQIDNAVRARIHLKLAIRDLEESK